MDKTFDEAIAGIRKAERGVEVREDIAQGMEYVEQFAGVATTKAQESADSAAAARQALTDTLAAKTEALQTISDARTAALNDVAESTDIATGAANTATEKAAAAAESETSAQSSATSAGQSAQAASADAVKASASAAAAKASADKAAAAVSTDKTLTIEGAPADAKTVGDALENLKLPIATAKTLGGIKVGSGLTVTADGTLSADSALAAYPVGSIYQSTDATSPAVLFGGTWEQIASERVLMGASNTHAAGSTTEAGLPDIQGSAALGYTDWNLITALKSPSGAFSITKKSGAGSYPSCSVDKNSTAGTNTFSFSASASNAIYGASNTVQPAAYYVYIWHRVA